MGILEVNICMKSLYSSRTSHPHASELLPLLDVVSTGGFWSYQTEISEQNVTNSSLTESLSVDSMTHT